VASGRWQQPFKGVVITQSGPPTDRQVLRLALLRAGPQAVLAGLTAARLDGLVGFGDKMPFADGPIHLINKSHRKLTRVLPPLQLIVHTVPGLGLGEVHPVKQPRRTRIERSIVDAAAWMPSERGAMAVLAAGVQQRLVRVEDLRAVAQEHTRLRRHRLILQTLGDIEGGAQALSELDFTRKVVRAYRLPEPDRQVARTDGRGRRRWLDVTWERWKVVAEIDGAQHDEPLQRWEDMDRDIDLQIEGGYVVLRFSAWIVRSHPDYVARRVLQALRRAGYPR
jgi:Protein of unknown function (DUF559)